MTRRIMRSPYVSPWYIAWCLSTIGLLAVTVAVAL